jgi:hypothetical protein
MIRKPQCLSRCALPQKRTFVSLVVLAVGLLMLDGPAAFAQVTTQLCFAIDGSGSINSTGADFQLEIGGIAAAIEDPMIVRQDGSVEISVVQFPGTLEVGPVVIDSAATATATANAIRNISQAGGGTPMEQGINDCANAITTSPAFASSDQQVINVTTDGVPNNQTAAFNASNAAMAAGIDQLHAEAVGLADTNFLLSLVFPQPGELVPSGGMPTDPRNRGFVLVVDSFADFAVAIETKIIIVITPPRSERCAAFLEGPAIELSGIGIIPTGNGVFRQEAGEGARADFEVVNVALPCGTRLDVCVGNEDITQPDFLLQQIFLCSIADSNLAVGFAEVDERGGTPILDPPPDFAVTPLSEVSGPARSICDAVVGRTLRIRRSESSSSPCNEDVVIEGVIQNTEQSFFP